MADSAEHASDQNSKAKKPISSGQKRVRKRPSTRRLRHHIRNVNHVRLALLVAMLFTLLVATMFRTTPIIFMAALLFTAQFTATLAARFLGRGLQISRALPEIGYVGDTVQGQIEVQNGARLPAFLVHVEPGEMEDGTRSKASTRLHSSPEIAGHAARLPLSLVSDSELLLPILQPGESVEWQPRWKLNRRGVWDVPSAQIGARDPLGLFTSSTLNTQPQTIMVLPRPVPLERVDFRGGESHTHTPQHTSIAADAFDFHGIRAWQAGEAVRRVHWKSTARTGELHMVEWEEDFGSDLCVLLDLRATRKPSKNEIEPPDDVLEVLITLAASVTAHLLNSGHAVRLFCWQQDNELQLMQHEARSGRDLVEALKWLAELESLSPAKNQTIPDFLADASQEFSLSYLAREASPHLQSTRAQGEAILMLCAAQADYSSAVAALAGTGAETPTVVAVDAVSFEPQTSAPASTHKNSKSPANSSRREENFSVAGRVRVLRQGQSLAAVLEQ